jgi:type II secretory pathway component PulF
MRSRRKRTGNYNQADLRFITMTDTSEEHRLLNNVAVMLDLGWDIITAIKAIRDDVSIGEVRDLYDTMLARLEDGEELGDVLAESKLIHASTSRLIIRSGQSAGMLQERLKRTAELVCWSSQGGWDPRRRYIETWAVLVEVGVSLDQALVALAEDFADQELGRLSQEFLQARRKNKPLYPVAESFPEFFSKQCCQVFHYGEKRNLAKALRSIVLLV